MTFTRLEQLFDSIARLLKAAGVSRADVMTFAAGADMVKEAI